jgi:hypothetical protein
VKARGSRAEAEIRPKGDTVVGRTIRAARTVCYPHSLNAPAVRRTGQACVSGNRSVHFGDLMILLVGIKRLPHKAIDIRRTGCLGDLVVLESNVSKSFGLCPVAVHRQVHLRSSPERILSRNDDNRRSTKPFGVVTNGCIEVINGKSYVDSAHERTVYDGAL